MATLQRPVLILVVLAGICQLALVGFNPSRLYAEQSYPGYAEHDEQGSFCTIFAAAQSYQVQPSATSDQCSPTINQRFHTAWILTTSLMGFSSAQIWSTFWFYDQRHAGLGGLFLTLAILSFFVLKHGFKSLGGVVLLVIGIIGLMISLLPPSPYLLVSLGIIALGKMLLSEAIRGPDVMRWFGY